MEVKYWLWQFIKVTPIVVALQLHSTTGWVICIFLSIALGIKTPKIFRREAAASNAVFGNTNAANQKLSDIKSRYSRAMAVVSFLLAMAPIFLIVKSGSNKNIMEYVVGAVFFGVCCVVLVWQGNQGKSIERRHYISQDAILPGATGQVILGSRWKALRLLGLSSIMVAPCLYIPHPWGWFLAAPFALGIPLSILMLLPSSTSLRINKNGFEVRHLWRGKQILWRDVAFIGADEGLNGKNRMVYMNFSPTYQGQEKARAFAKKMTGFEGAIPDSYELGPDELAELLREWQARSSA